MDYLVRLGLLACLGFLGQREAKETLGWLEPRGRRESSLLAPKVLRGCLGRKEVEVILEQME